MGGRGHACALRRNEPSYMLARSRLSIQTPYAFLQRVKSPLETIASSTAMLDLQCCNRSAIRPSVYGPGSIDQQSLVHQPVGDVEKDSWRVPSSPSARRSVRTPTPRNPCSSAGKIRFLRDEVAELRPTPGPGASHSAPSRPARSWPRGQGTTQAVRLVTAIARSAARSHRVL